MRVFIFFYFSVGWKKKEEKYGQEMIERLERMSKGGGRQTQSHCASPVSDDEKLWRRSDGGVKSKQKKTKLQKSQRSLSEVWSKSEKE